MPSKAQNSWMSVGQQYPFGAGKDSESSDECQTTFVSKKGKANPWRTSCGGIGEPHQKMRRDDCFSKSRVNPDRF